MNQPHDSAYKKVFSHRDAVADLLRGFVASQWLQLIDLDSLERAPTEYISEASHRRSNDIIWRVRWRHEEQYDWLYIYVILEFQSSVDATMPLRLAEYITLFYRDLIKAAAVPSGRSLILPPIVPVVLYNGAEPWSAATDLSEVIYSPAELTSFQLGLRYIYLDEARIPAALLSSERNIIALLFRLEQARQPQDLIDISRALAAILDSDTQSTLRDAFVAVIRESLLTRLPHLDLGAKLPLEEVPQMIGDNMLQWAHTKSAEAHAAGRSEGQTLGEARALVQLIQHQVKTGVLDIDAARAQIEALLAAGSISDAAGRAVLQQLG